MNTIEWVSLAKNNVPELKWAIVKYFGEEIYAMILGLLNIDPKRAYTYLNTIWFELPDGLFNIKENPPGWGAFLKVLEANVNFDI